MKTAYEQRIQVSFHGSIFLLVWKCNNLIKEKGRTHGKFLKGFLGNIIGFGIKQFKGLTEKSKFKGTIGRKTFQS